MTESELTVTIWARARAWLRRRLGRGGHPSLEPGASSAPADRVGQSLAPPDRPDVLAAVGAACEAQQRLQFAFSSRGGDLTRRDVEPYRLIRSGQRWYLLGYDVGRDDWRTFRLDRMQSPVSTGPGFTPRDIPTGPDAPYLAAAGAVASEFDGGGGPAGPTGGVLPEPTAPDAEVVAATAQWARDMLVPGAAVVIDTETTDLPGAICEIAVIDAATGETLLDTLVDPGLAMSPRAQAVHGIAPADLAGAPTWAAVLPRLLAAAAGRQVLAYNVEFDEGVVRADTTRYGLTLGPLESPDRWDCVMVRRAQTLPGGSPLALGAGHRARGDALAALEVLHELAALQPALSGPSRASSGRTVPP